MNRTFLLTCMTWIMFSSAFAQFIPECHNCTVVQGGIVRGDSTQRKLHLVFTADEFGEGLPVIIQKLKQHNIHASFFFTGRFYRNPDFKAYIRQLKKDGHYLGPHSDAHLLYCDWTKRDSLLISRETFREDMFKNLRAMGLKVPLKKQRYYIPSYEWWNDSIAAWSREINLQVISFTPGVRTNADYTYPEMASYKSSDWIIQSVKDLLRKNPNALNGAIMLIHAGTDPRRKDKLYDRLDELVKLMEEEGIGWY